LDVEFSKHVEDDSVVYIKRLKGLVKINVFRTNLSMEGQVIEFLEYKSQIYELYINKFHLVAQKNY